MSNVQDYLGQDIEVGDRVLCDQPIEGFLTNDKEYVVIGLREEESRVVIIDDRGLEGWYNSRRFVSSGPASGAV